MTLRAILRTAWDDSYTRPRSALASRFRQNDTGRVRIPVALCFLLGSLPSLAAPLEPERIDSLPSAERAAWHDYLQHSESRARTDQAALEAELEAEGLEVALPAPSGGDFKMSKKPGDPWFGGPEAKELTEIILSYQTPAGGWSKHGGYSKGPRRPGMLWSSQYDPGRSPHYLATFDNRSTTEQLQFLANVAQATDRDDCREAIRRGLAYILAAQFPNGGWPQVYPLEGGYHDNITLNDDATAHILELLRDVATGNEHFDFLSREKRDDARDALEHGVACLLEMQVRQDGTPTGWAGQHDPLTLAPAEARKMEPSALASTETANLLKVLMTIEDPDRDLVGGIEAGLAWLEKVRITGLKRTKIDGRTAYVEDSGSDEVHWARFYHLETNRPLFPGRDGVIYDSFDEMAKHNKLGYDFYSTRPGGVLNSSRRKWLKMLAE